MTIDKETNFLIIGLGLMGGSYARALTQKGYTNVYAITKEQKDIDYALAEGFIKEGSIDPQCGLAGKADIVIFSLYPHVFFHWIQSYQHLFKPGVLITDVTGVKSTVVPAVQKILRPDAEFIGAHPMAGREVYGVQNSDAAIFHGANYIVTPTELNTEKAINACKSLGKILGFEKISCLDINQHDKIIGFLSQLTHCIAVSLMTCGDTGSFEKYTGDSFRDLTRIANINEVMWSELFLLNRDVLAQEIDSFTAELERLKAYLLTGNRDALMEMMKLSSARRALFDKN